MGVGGLFGFDFARISRAPLWLREMGLEWVWRLLPESARLWRRSGGVAANGLRHRFRFRRKRLAWTGVVRGTYLFKRIVDRPGGIDHSARDHSGGAHRAQGLLSPRT